jgi:hypothetical protein
MFGQVAQVIAGLRADVDQLRSEVAQLKGARGDGKPMNKAIRRSRQVGDDFMAKALSAQTAGRINGTQVAIAESHINAGKAPPKDIIAAVLGS